MKTIKTTTIAATIAFITSALPEQVDAAIANIVISRIAGGGVARLENTQDADYAATTSSTTGTISDEASLTYGVDDPEDPFGYYAEIRHGSQSTFTHSGDTFSFSGSHYLRSTGHGTPLFPGPALWTAGASSSGFGTPPMDWAAGSGEMITFDVLETVNFSISGTAFVRNYASALGSSLGTIRIELEDAGMNQILNEDFGDDSGLVGTLSSVNLAGTLAPGTYTLFLNSLLSSAGGSSDIPGLFYDANHSIEMSFTAIPEPGAPMLAAAALGLAFRRRRD